MQEECESHKYTARPATLYKNYPSLYLYDIKKTVF